jgi:hypothetical protein
VTGNAYNNLNSPLIINQIEQINNAIKNLQFNSSIPEFVIKQTLKARLGTQAPKGQKHL